MKKLLKRLFSSIFKEELASLTYLENRLTQRIERMDSLFENMGVSADIHVSPHRYSPSWAAISIQGKGMDYIKFIDLGNKEIYQIQKFLRHFERGNVSIDANPQITGFIKSGL